MTDAARIGERLAKLQQQHFGPEDSCGGADSSGLGWCDKHFLLDHIAAQSAALAEAVELIQKTRHWLAGWTEIGKEIDAFLATPAAERGRALLEVAEALADYLAPHDSSSHPGGGGDPDAAVRLARLRAACDRLGR